MTAIVQGEAARRQDLPSFTLFRSLPAMLAVAAIMVVAAGSSLVPAVWRDGGFADTDDAMRMVQVREFLAGQRWFDLTAYRLDPAHALTMHWSRFIDAPLAALITLAGLLLDATMAERAVRLAWPWALHAVLLVSVVTTARRLMGTAAIAPAAFLAPMMFATSGQFIPGRVDHHSFEIVAMLLMLRASIEALSPDTRSWRAAALAAALGMGALAVSLEDLPFVAAIMTVFALAWAWDGQRMSGVLLAFGVSLASGAVVAFVATVPARDYALAYCDAYTIPHALAAAGGGAVLALLALLGRRLTHRAARLGAAALGGAIVLATVGLLYPACMGEPLAAVDPLVRGLWLAHVNEARPLLRAIGEQPAIFVPVAVPLIVGLAGLGAAFVSASPDRRMAWLPVVMLAIVATALGLWQVRMLAPAAILGALGGAWAVVRMVETPWRKPIHLYAAVALAFMAACPAVWSIAITPVAGRAKDAEDKAPRACLAPGSYAALRLLPPGLVLAPLDLGAHILAFTHHSVLAAPYHRNNRGNRTVIEAMIGSPETARHTVAAEGVDYVVACSTLPEMEVLRRRAPDGLAARLKSGEPPAWLEQRPGGGALSIFTPRG